MSATLELSEVLDLKAAGPLNEQLLALQGQALILDASKVQRIGGLCLQVLIAAQAAWRADNNDFSVAQPSPEFDAGWTLFAAPPLNCVAT